MSQAIILALIPGTQLFGSERGNLEALSALQNSGAKIIVAVTSREKAGGDVGDLARDLGFETIELPYGGPFNRDQMTRLKSYRKRQIKRLWTNSVLIKEAIKKHRATHILTGSTLAYLFCALGLTFHRIPVIFRVGDAPETRSYFQLWTWKFLAFRARKIVAISNFVRDKVGEVSPSLISKCTVIHNVPISRKAPLDRRKTLYLKAEKCAFQLVYVGQMTRKKGVEHLIQSLIELDDAAIGCWVIGGSRFTVAFENQLMQRVKDSKTRTKISFEGFISDPRPYYEAADWHIAPSVYEEPLGNVVQEAKASGTPSIVSPRGGLPELIQHEIDGIVLPHITSEEISSTIIQLKSEPKRSKACGEAARTSIEMRLSRSQFERQWKSIIEL